MGFLDNIFRRRPRPTPQPQPTPQPRPPQPVPPSTAGSGAPESSLLDAVNSVRVAHGRSPLTLDDRLSMAAGWQAGDCARLGRLTHTGADGSSPWQRIARAGYPYRDPSQAQENAAAGWASGPAGDGSGFTASQAVDGWLHSPPHRMTLLGDWDHLGAGRAQGRDGTVYWIGTFGRLR
jgi:uncharacterized protein YkwD